MKLTVDGFEIEVSGLYSGDTDLERLNTYLEAKFNNHGIKSYMSALHPELFPGHIGLQCDSHLCLTLRRYSRGGLDECGEYIQGYDSHMEPDSEKYKTDILNYFREHDPAFYRFIATRII